MRGEALSPRVESRGVVVHVCLFVLTSSIETL